jgi:hypothetical protein
MEDTAEKGSTCQTPLPLSEMSEKLLKIDPTGLLNLSDNEVEEMEQDNNPAGSAGVAGDIHAGVHNLSNSEDADSAETPAPPPPLPPQPSMMARGILRSEFRDTQVPNFEPEPGSGYGFGPETNRGADTQSPTGSPAAAASTAQINSTVIVTTHTGSSAAAAFVPAAAVPATTMGVAYPATSTSHGTSMTPASGTSIMLGTNTNQSNFQKIN